MKYLLRLLNADVKIEVLLDDRANVAGRTIDMKSGSDHGFMSSATRN